MSVIPQSVAYKESGIPWVGKIPEHWEISRFKYFYCSNMGETILAQDLEDEGIPIYSATEEERFFGKIKNPKIKLKEGDFVIPARGNSIGAVKLVKELSTCTQTTIYSKQRKYSVPNYVYYFLIGFREHLFRFIQTAIPQITVSQVNDNPLLYPSIQEQQAIANFLDKKTHQIEEFIDKKQKLITLLEEKKQTLINQCVTQGLDSSTPLKDSGVEWIGKIPTHWEVRKLKHFGKFQNGINIGAEAFGSGFPFVSYGDVYKSSSLPKAIQGLVESSEIDKKLYSVKEGDIFFTRTSETIEEIGMSSVCFQTIPNATFAGFLIRFRPSGNELDKGFSKFYFRSNLHRIFFIRENGLVTRASLSQELLKDLPVLLPPLEEQKAIAEYLDTQIEKIDLAICKIKSQINLIKEYKTTLISEAVCGRVGID